MLDARSFVNQYFPLGKKSPSGFHILKCPICHDKKDRAGFKFTTEGFGYNCFRGSCRHKFRWEPGSPPAKAMYELFATAGVSEFDIDSALSQYYTVSSTVKKEEKDPNRIIIRAPEEILPPGGSIRLENANTDDRRTREAIRFLLSKGLDPLGYPYYITNKPPQDGEYDFRNRIIIPYYRNGKVIFYQGRWYPERETKIKYLNVPGVSRDQMFFNLDELYKHTDAPLVLVEGVFDCIPLISHSISYGSNVLTKDQLEMLKRCRRRKILIPDYDAAGKFTVHQALEAGIEVSFPDWGDCKDLGKAAQRFGPVRVAGMIHEGIANSQIEAEVQAELLCKDI